MTSGIIDEMHEILATIFVATGFVAVIAAVPQLVQLLRIKKSDEFEVLSWIAWFAYQLVSFVYTLDIHAYVISAINVLWIMFYGSMIFLILKFQTKRKR